MGDMIGVRRRQSRHLTSHWTEFFPKWLMFTNCHATPGNVSMTLSGPSASQCPPRLVEVGMCDD